MNKIPITWLDKLVQFGKAKEEARKEYSNSTEGTIDYFLRNDLYNYNMWGKFPSEHPSVQRKIKSFNRSIESLYYPHDLNLQNTLKDALDRLMGPKRDNRSQKENPQQ